MSFLKKFFRNPVRIAAAVYTFGTSEAYRAAVPKKIQAIVPYVVGGAASIITANPAPLALATAYARATAPKPQGVTPMAFNVGNFLSTTGTAFSGSNLGFLQNIGAGASFASAFVPQRTMGQAPSSPVVMTGSGSSNLPAVRAIGGQALTKDVFEAGAKVLSRMGLPVPATTGRFTSVLKRALSGLASFARRTPTGTIVSLLAGLGLTAIEASNLIGWYSVKKKRRHMNPTNAKALKRAGRRIKGFHKMCQHLDFIKPHRTAHRVGRCGKCKKTSCSC